jgi:hypothetical protein
MDVSPARLYRVFPRRYPIGLASFNRPGEMAGLAASAFDPASVSATPGGARGPRVIGGVDLAGDETPREDVDDGHQ